jgi:DNA polymerase-3 subunit epsilon
MCRFKNLSLTRPLVVFDAETTGCDLAADRIIELAAVKFLPHAEEPETFHVRLDPGVPIPPQATAVHGITDADVAGGPAFAEVAGGLLTFLGGADLAGFNVKGFDLPLLVAELRRCGQELDLRGVCVLDPLQVFREREPRDLAAAVRLYCGREHEGAHSALADALAAAAVLDGQLARYPDLPRGVPELHRRYCPVDLAGRFRLEGGRVALAFGKHAGRRLAEVAAEDPDYLRWMLTKDFLPDAARILREALRRFATTG